MLIFTKLLPACLNQAYALKYYLSSLRMLNCSAFVAKNYYVNGTWIKRASSSRTQQKSSGRVQKVSVFLQARPRPQGEAFQVKQSDKYLTVPDDVVLHGEERSKRRAEFDAAMVEKERRRKVWPSKKIP